MSTPENSGLPDRLFHRPIVLHSSLRIQSIASIATRLPADSLSSANHGRLEMKVSGLRSIDIRIHSFFDSFHGDV
jgi:hypothetical protein